MILTPTKSGRFEFSPVPDQPPNDVATLWAARGFDELSALRSRYIGYVLQHGGLLPYLSVRDNIELSLELLGLPRNDIAINLAAQLGIEQQLDKRPAELSVGQRQRAAIARALAHSPPIVIADEPTAAIDPPNAARIIALLVQLTEALGVTLIVATHAHELVENAGFRLVELPVTMLDEQTMAVEVRHA